MTHIIRAFALTALLLPFAAHAGDVTVSDAWARASAGAVKNGGAFLTLRNTGPAADSLLSAATDVAAKVELHTHVKDGEIMRMRQVDSIAVPAGATTVLQPGGLHVMFFGLKAPLKEGTTFPLALTFKTAGTMTVPVTVKGVGAMGGQMDHGQMDHGQMDHGKMDHGQMDHGKMKP